MANYDTIIAGAGHNGLVTASYLAKAGKKVLILERRSTIGGIAATEELFPGFKYSTCAHLAGAFSKEIVADLDLKKHGFASLALDPLLFAPSREGNGLLVPRDPAKAAVEIKRHFKVDASKYHTFCALAKDLSAFLRTLYGVPLPDKANPGSFNPAELLKIGWKFHRLGEKEMYEFLCILPMSSAVLVNEWFEYVLL